MRVGGNFYIDVVDVIASAKNTNLHALLKYDIFPVENNYSVCKICEESPCEDDVEFLNDFQLDETQSLLLSDNSASSHVQHVYRMGLDQGISRRQTNKHTNKHTYKQTNIHTNKQTYIQTNKHTYK